MKRDRPPLSQDVRFDRESSTEQSGRETAPGRAPAESPTRKLVDTTATRRYRRLNL